MGASFVWLWEESYPVELPALLRALQRYFCFAAEQKSKTTIFRQLPWRILPVGLRLLR